MQIWVTEKSECIRRLQEDLILEAEFHSVELFSWKNNRVSNNRLVWSDSVSSKNCDRWEKFAVVVEEIEVVCSRVRSIRVELCWCSFNSCPGTDSTVPADDTVQNATMFFDNNSVKDDRVLDASSFFNNNI